MSQVWYHGDLDGKCAAWWVYTVASKIGDGDWKLISVDYDMDTDIGAIIDEVSRDEQVYIVDFSIEPEQMDQLLAITKDVTWIDHHISAIEKYADYPHGIKGLRYDGIAGCALTYAYISKMTNRGIGGVTREFDPSMIEDAPAAIQYIADRDVWTWEFGDLTKYFNAGMLSHDTDPKSGAWWLAYKSPEDIINDGKIVERFNHYRYIGLGKKYAYTCNWEGHSCMVINMSGTGSEIFDCIPDHHKYDIHVTWTFNGSEYDVSLYSKKVDVSKLAGKFGGGGHAGASGFNSKELFFKES